MKFINPIKKGMALIATVAMALSPLVFFVPTITRATADPIATHGGTSINSLAIASDGTLYAADGDGYVNKIVSGTVTAYSGIGESPWGDMIALSPDGNTLYVGTQNDGNILTFNTAALTAGDPIETGATNIQALAVAPSGTLYIIDGAGYVDKIVSGSVTAHVGTGGSPYGDTLALSSDGNTLYVGTQNDGNILTFNTAALTAGDPIVTGAAVIGTLIISPNGGTLYAGEGYGHSGGIYPVNTATKTAGDGITSGTVYPTALAISPNGKTLYVGDGNSGAVYPINTATKALGSAITTGMSGSSYPDTLAISPDGNTLYAGDGNAGNIYPVTVGYTVTFDSQGGSAVSPITGIASGDTATLPTAPTMTDYTFTGWNTAANGSGTTFDGTTTVTADVTVYAQWTVTPPTLDGSIYRFYDVQNGEHFYTASTAERDMIIARWGNIYHYEGVAWERSSSPIAIYRFYDVVNGEHFYTTSVAEKNMVTAKWGNIYHYEGIGWNDFTPGGPTVYRFYDVQNGGHFFTASSTERDTVISKWGYIYKYEGIAW